MAESTTLGFTALLIGLLDGLLGAILLVWYVSLSIPIQLNFPPERIGFWVIASFIITLASTFVPSYRSSQKNVVAAIHGRPMRKDYVEGPYQQARSLLAFRHLEQVLLRNQTKIWQVFLVVLLIATLNYLFDPYLLLRGLVPFDLFMPSLNFLSDPSTPVQVFPLGLSGSLSINLLLFFVGLTAIVPICSFLVSNGQETNFENKFRKNLLWGLLAAFLVFFTWVPFFFIDKMLIGLSMTAVRDENFSIFKILEGWRVIYLVFLIFILALVFQRIWAILVYKGLNPDISLKSAIRWAKQSAGKGQLGFVALLYLHELIQIVLTFVFRAIPTFPQAMGPLIGAQIPPPLSPWSFLIMVSFEIGFFLFLILYQIAHIPRPCDRPA
jgi:hypothetical protein